MRGLKVKNGIVDNIAVFNTSDKLPDGWIAAPNGVGIGWTDDGDGEFSAPPKPPLTDEELAAAERGWRDGELRCADIEISKAEDTVGAFDAATWRTYRIALRDWPADPAFPDSASRPVAPDAG